MLNLFLVILSPQLNCHHLFPRYDNEFGYSHRVADLLLYMHSKE